MKPRLLFLVSGDPRTSPRPAEAVRIAAGVAVWQRADVTLCLLGPAALALQEDAEALVDGELFAQHLPLLVGAGSSIFVTGSTDAPAAEKPAAVPCAAISLDRLAGLSAANTTVLHF